MLAEPSQDFTETFRHKTSSSEHRILLWFCDSTLELNCHSIIVSKISLQVIIYKALRSRVLLKKHLGKGNPSRELGFMLLLQQILLSSRTRQVLCLVKQVHFCTDPMVFDQIACHATDPMLVTHFRAYLTFGKQHFLAHLYINSQICCSSGFTL